MNQADLQSDWAKPFAGAAAALAGHVRRTPLMRSNGLSERVGAPVFLKLENLQVSGSFKARPAFSSLLANLDRARAVGVVTSSSGNFGAAVSFAARRLGVRATIVAAAATSSFKLDLIRRFGAEIVFVGPEYEARQRGVDEIRERTGAIEIHPHSSIETIAGDSTVGLEIVTELPGAGLVVFPTSGGGLLSGGALAMRAQGYKGRIAGCQSTGNPAMAVSFRAGRAMTVKGPGTICDGLVATTPGERPFGIIKETVDEVVAVDDAQALEALAVLAAEERLIVEPSSATGIAALLTGALDPKGRPVAVVLSGGNVDPVRWAAWASRKG